METINTIETDTAQRLPTGWDMARLEDVVDILDSQRVPINSKEREKRVGQVPYYGATGQVGWIDDHLFDEELVLLGEDGAPFLDSTKQKAYIIRGKSWVNNHAHVLRARNGIPNPYIKYYLDTVDYHDYVTGTTRLKLNQAMMRKILVPVAPPTEQKLIVAEIEKQFSRLDEAVANLKRVKANLKRYKAAVLKAAVEGKLTAVWRRSHPVIESADKYLKRILEQKKKNWQKENPDKKYKDTTPLDASSMASLPEGWAWTMIDQFVLSAVDCPHSTPKYVDQGVICARTSDFNPGYLDLSKASFVTEASYNKRVSRLIPMAGDVLYSREGGILGVACMIPEKTKLCLGQRMMLLRTESRDSSKYLMHVLNSQFILNKVRALTGGSASPHLNVGEIRNFVLPMPPQDERAVILQEIERRFSGSDMTEKTVDLELIRAERLRQAILQRAYSGELVNH